MKEDPLTHELPACEILVNFNRADRRALSEFGTFVIFKPREIVIEEKAQQDCLYFVINGLLQARHRTEDGTVKPLGTIKAGEWFGEINIFHPRASSAEVMSMETTKVWCIDRSHLEDFLNDSPSMGCMLLLGVGEVMARRTRKLTNMLMYLS